MKKLLLSLIIASLGFVAGSQVTSFVENFESGSLPADWVTIDNGHNLGTWFVNDRFAATGMYHLELDTYESDSTDSGAGDDYVILPHLTVKEGTTLAFWAASRDDEFLDGFTVYASTAGTDAADFTIELLNVAEIPFDYTYYEIDLTADADISADDDIYIAIYSNTNGSGVLIDNIALDVIVDSEVSEGFDNEIIPTGWTTIDLGNNPTGWIADTYDPYSGAGHLAVDAYEADSVNSGQAEDYLITPLMKIMEGYAITFWAKSDHDEFFDGFLVLASRTGKEKEDFTDTIAAFSEVPNAYTKYSYVLSDNDSLNAGDFAYISILVNSNGSWLYLDEFSYAPGAAPDELLSEDFEEGIPETWTIIDEGAVEGTWTIDSTAGLDESFAAYLDTYDEAAEGGADDWLITPSFELVEEYIFSFWLQGNSSFPDTLDVLYSTTGTAKEDFTILMENILTPGEFTKYQFDFIDSSGLAAGTSVYVAFHCTSNGSRVFMDNVRYGKYVEPGVNKAYSTGEESIAVLFDAEVEQDSLNLDNFSLTGSEELTAAAATVDDSNAKLVHLELSGAMTADNILDTLAYAKTDDKVMFYGGILPLSYANLTNPEGTIDIEDNHATFRAIVMDTNSVDRVFVADRSGARNGAIVYGTEFYDQIGSVGDEILFYGFFSPFDNQTEIIDASLIEVVSTGNELYEPALILGSDIAISNEAETDPAEKYEGVLVTVHGATVTGDFDGAFYTLSDDNEATSFYVGENSRYDVFAGDFDETVMTVGITYNVTGFVIGRGENYFLTPRGPQDITVTSSVEDNPLADIELYPNPVQDQIHYRNVKQPVRLDIISVTGQQFGSYDLKGQENGSISVGDLKPGVYTLMLIQENGERLIKRITKK